MSKFKVISQNLQISDFGPKWPFFDSFWSKRPRIAKPQTAFTQWFYDFFHKISILHYFLNKYCTILTIFASFMALSRLFQESLKNWILSQMGQKLSESHHIWWAGSAVLRSIGKVVKSARKRQFFYYFGCFWKRRHLRSTYANWGSQWSSWHKFPAFLA